MAKSVRVKNNFTRWMVRAVPYFLVLFFVFLNVAVFVFQPNSYVLQSIHGWDETTQEKDVRLNSFKSIYASKYMTEMTDQLNAYFVAKEAYPRKLNELGMDPDEKNWIYNHSFKNYDVIYKSQP